VYGHWWLNA